MRVSKQYRFLQHASQSSRGQATGLLKVRIAVKGAASR